MKVSSTAPTIVVRSGARLDAGEQGAQVVVAVADLDAEVVQAKPPSRRAPTPRPGRPRPAAGRGGLAASLAADQVDFKS
jgi:hypothetical protein